MFLLVLNLLHVEVRLAEILGGLELLRLLDVEPVQHFLVRSGEVTRRLSGQPSRGHVRYLRRRNEVIHLLRYGGGHLLVVDGDGARGLLGLAEHVVLRPFQRLLVTGSPHEDVAARGDDFLHPHLAVVRLQLRKFLKT